MASQVIYLLMTFSLLLAVVAAVDFDYTKEDLDTVLAFVDEGNNFEIDSGRVRRGGGRRIIRCIHHENGATCVCDRRFKRNYHKYYLLCVGQGAGEI